MSGVFGTDILSRGQVQVGLHTLSNERVHHGARASGCGSRCLGRSDAQAAGFETLHRDVSSTDADRQLFGTEVVVVLHLLSGGQGFAPGSGRCRLSQQATHSCELQTAEDDPARSVFIDHRVASGLRVDDVGVEAFSADERIVARAADERVIAITSIQRIISVCADDLIVAAPSDISHSVLQIGVHIAIQTEIQHLTQKPTVQIVLILI